MSPLLREPRLVGQTGDTFGVGDSGKREHQMMHADFVGGGIGSAAARRIESAAGDWLQTLREMVGSYNMTR